MNNSVRTPKICLSGLEFRSDSPNLYLHFGAVLPSGVLCRDRVRNAQLLARGWQAGGETKVQAARGEAPVVRHCRDGTVVRACHKKPWTVSLRGL